MERRIMKVLTSAFAAAALLGLAACGGGSAPASSATPASTAKPGALAGFGVPECDDYLTKYEACINSKVPEAGRAMIRQQLDATRAQWQQAASAPQGKQSLATGC